MTDPPRLEDYLDGPSRAGAITEFRQREPGDGAPASRETAAYLSYDDRNLYVVFVCKDQPSLVRARMSKREAIDNDDAVGVILDTFHDRQRAYLFVSNPLGVQADAIVSEGQEDDYSYDTLWYSRGRFTDDGYAVWMAIPFRSLRFPAGAGQKWGVAVGRRITRTNEEVFWPFITRREQSFLRQLASLEGMERISPGRNLQFIPYGIATGARFFEAPGTAPPGFRTRNELRAGLDSKIVLRDSLTVDLALNPDFSQVESDEPQVTVNQRFEVFFPEKRPFFIENAGYFATPINLFFSRRVVDPEFGARVTGKLGSWALGALAMDDRAEGDRAAPGTPGSGERAAIGVLRLKREFSGQSSLGAMFTRRDFGFGSNEVLAADARFKLGRAWIVEGQAARSYTRLNRQERAALSGPAYRAEIDHEGRRLYAGSQYSDYSPDFRSELGYVPRVDIRRSQNRFQYQWRPETGPVTSFGPGYTYTAIWGRDGRLQEWTHDPMFRAEFKGPSFLMFRWAEGYELFRGRGFRKRSPGFEFITERLKWLLLSGSLQNGHRINYYPGAGLAPFSASSLDTRFQLSFIPWKRMRVDETYLYSRLGVREGQAIAGAPPGAAVFNNHIWRTRLNYQFTRELSLRAIVDYNAVLANPALVSLDPARGITRDVLLTWLLHPGTAVYIGYTDRYENLAYVLTQPYRTYRTGSLSEMMSARQFFVKLSYLLRF
ncbi:MAG: carbohydrate binding family 9 domain-containing protein [Bryobacterales bacterium]|nr:carbohydrate binding family 9 domain-containing protein [Bryobacterales bacterium]